MEGEEEEGRKAMGNDGNPRGNRGQRLGTSTRSLQGKNLGFKGSTCSLSPPFKPG